MLKSNICTHKASTKYTQNMKNMYNEYDFNFEG